MIRIRPALAAALGTGVLLAAPASADAATYTFHGSSRFLPNTQGMVVLAENVSTSAQTVTVRFRKADGTVLTTTTETLSPNQSSFDIYTNSTGITLAVNAEVEAQTDRFAITDEGTDIAGGFTDSPGDWVVIGPSGGDNATAGAAVDNATATNTKVDSLAASVSSLTASVSAFLKKASKSLAKILKKV